MVSFPVRPVTVPPTVYPATQVTMTLVMGTLNEVPVPLLTLQIAALAASGG